jgi:pimeloyl-ACP methyl ester carboxylesterase
MTATQETRTKRVDLGHLQVAYSESGSGEPLILVHGGESDRHSFRTMFPYLGDGIRAIAYDQRDSGDSINSEAAYTITDLAQDLASLIDALGLEKAHLLGVSFGSVVAMHTALEHPERVASVSLVAGVPRAAELLERVRAISAMEPAERRDVMFDVLFTPEGLSNNPDLIALGRRALTDRPRELMERRLAAISQHDVIDRLPSMQVAALVVHGTDDPIAPLAMAELMAEAIPGAVLRTIPGGRHGISTEFADQVADFVREFLGLGPSDSPSLET